MRRTAPGTDASDPTNADAEVMLDIEVAGAVAPGARIVVYFAPNTAQGFFDVINHAVHDSDHNPTVISLSWGGAENPSDSMNAQLNQVLQDAAALGVTFCVASGDSGSRDNPNDPDHATVDFPGSSPFALACGGTTLQVSGTAISQEVVWQDHSGGGVSRIFDLPTYQLNANVPAAVNPVGPVRRGVPDVAGDADPATGYKILVNGQSITDRRHERRGSALGRPHRASTRSSARPSASSTQPFTTIRGLSRHHLRRQHRLPGRPRLGRVHRAGLSQWPGRAASAGGSGDRECKRERENREQRGWAAVAGETGLRAVSHRRRKTT